MGEEFGCPGGDLGPVEAGGDTGAEGLQYLRDVFAGGGLVAGHRDVVVIDTPEVDPGGLGGGLDRSGPARHARGHGVEESVVHHLDAGSGEAAGQAAGVAVHPAGDRGKPVGAVIGGVHRGHHRQQDLGGADVGGGPVPADVLFAGLQGQSVRRRSVGVDGDADQSPGQLAGVGGVGGQVPGVRAAESHGHTETLGAAECHVRANLPRRGRQRARQQIGADGHQRAAVVGLRDERGPVGEAPTGTGQLRDHAEELAVGQAVAQVGGDDLDAQWFGAGRQHGGRLGEHVDVHCEPVRRAADRTVHQRHRLGGGSGLIEHRGIGDVQAGEIGDHGLEVQQCLQPALADLRLVRRIGGVPGGVLHDVAQQHRRGQGVVVALTDHRHRHGVGIGQLPQFGQGPVFPGRGRQRGQAGGDTVAVEVVQNPRREGFGGQFVERADTDHTQDAVQSLGVEADVAVGECGIGVLGDGVLGHGALLARADATIGRPPPLSWVPERFSGANSAFPHRRAAAKRPPLSRGIVSRCGPGA